MVVLIKGVEMFKMRKALIQIRASGEKFNFSHYLDETGSKILAMFLKPNALDSVTLNAGIGF